MEYFKQLRGKNVVISRFLQNPVLDIEKSTNPGGLELFYLIKYLREECDVEPIVTYMSVRPPKGDCTWKYWKDIDWKNIDVVIHQPEKFNLFGGGWKNTTIDYLVHFTKNYNGLNLILYTDPSILWANPFKTIIDDNRNKMWYVSGRKDRSAIHDINVSTELRDKFENFNYEALFIGKDWNAFIQNSTSKSSHLITPKKCNYIKLTQYLTQNELKRPTVNNILKIQEKKYDVVYYGSNRGGARNRIIKELLDTEDVSSLFIKWNPKFKNSVGIDGVPHSELKTYLDSCRLSLVVGDPAHNNNITTYRIFENAKNECLSVIWHEYDTEHQIFPDMDSFYVKSKEDIVKLIQFLEEDPTRYRQYQKMQTDRLLNSIY